MPESFCGPAVWAQSTFVTHDQLRIPPTLHQHHFPAVDYLLTNCQFSGFRVEFEFPSAFVGGMVVP
jgi:hypothetical protein